LRVARWQNFANLLIRVIPQPGLSGQAYLGSVLVLLGTALALNLLWALVTLPLSIVLCHTILIGPEERYLAAKFGAEYTEYAASVRRWLGRK
jgi:protein-S-isoprenylcysteine O-methyltransferase Ste14